MEPNTLRELNLYGNNITNVNSPFSYDKLTELLTKNKNVKYSFSDNYLNYDLFPCVLQRKCNLVRQNIYKYNPIVFRNVGQENIRNFVNNIVDEPKNILNSTQTVHLSSVNKSVVSSVNKIKEFIKKHNIDIGKSQGSVNYNYFVKKYAIDIRNDKGFGDQNNYLYIKHSITELTYIETFELVWEIFDYLIDNDKSYNKDDLLERLYIELNDSVGYCYTGKYNRLINSLVGIIDGVYVGISSQEEIQMEMGKIIEKLNKDINPDSFEKALCDAKEIFRSVDETINKDDWLEALYDLAPPPKKISHNNKEYLQTWDYFIVELRTNNIIGVIQKDEIIFFSE
jgi:hypothetical protein